MLTKYYTFPQVIILSNYINKLIVDLSLFVYILLFKYSHFSGYINSLVILVMCDTTNFHFDWIPSKTRVILSLLILILFTKV